MIKPWSMNTFPKDKAVYIRQKGNPAGASLVLSIAPYGINIFVSPKGQGDVEAVGITWFELSVTCEQVLEGGNIGPCGEEK